MHSIKFCEKLMCFLYCTIQSNFAPPSPANVHKIPPPRQEGIQLTASGRYLRQIVFRNYQESWVKLKFWQTLVILPKQQWYHPHLKPLNSKQRDVDVIACKFLMIVKTGFEKYRYQYISIMDQNSLNVKSFYIYNELKLFQEVINWPK